MRARVMTITVACPNAPPARLRIIVTAIPSNAPAGAVRFVLAVPLDLRRFGAAILARTSVNRAVSAAASACRISVSVMKNLRRHIRFSPQRYRVVERWQRFSNVVHPADEPRKDDAFGCVVCKQIDRVHRARLAKAVDPADALLEANWVPRQFEIHDEAAPALKVQPLRTRVRRQQHIGGAVVEGLDCRAALLPRQAAMQDRQTPHALN